MTGFAAVEGGVEGISWGWEMRGVNARGLDLRLRLPERAQALEPDIRARLGRVQKRGAVQLGLRLHSDRAAAALTLDPDALSAAVTAIAQTRTALEGAGLEPGPVDPVAVLGLPGLSVDQEDTDLPLKAILADFDKALASFTDMRAQEGTALVTVISGQLDSIEALVARSAACVARRDETLADRYKAQIEALTAAAGQVVDTERLSHDLAAMTVKGDVSEEIDRLGAHIKAARALITKNEPIGRKLDFLMQEFNREANTLCSKSSDTELTQAGLDLKVVIDQMREQVQNLE